MPRMNNVPILAYHSVKDEPEYSIDVATSEFEKQMIFLYKKRLQDNFSG